MAKSRIKAHVTVSTNRTKAQSHQGKRGRKPGSSTTKTHTVHHRSTESHSTHSSTSPVSARTLSHSAARLIDQAAELLKEGISMGLREGAKGRQMLRDEAFDVVNSATKNLTSVINFGAEYAKKGIKKI